MKAPRSQRTAQRGKALTQEVFESLDFAFRGQDESDYGVDAHVESIEQERATGRLLGLQIKAGRSYLEETEGDHYVFRPDARHIDYWVNHALPIVVCLCDLESRKVFWQVIDAKTAIPTGVGYKILVPQGQRLDETAVSKLQAIMTPIVSSDRYSILKTEDSSIAVAQRRSLKILAHATTSKPELAGIIRSETERLKETCQVVWIYVYLSLEDFANSNRFCHSQWVSENLPKDFRPMTLEGEIVGEGISVSWNPDYSSLAELLSSERSSKDEYLAGLSPKVHEASVLLCVIEEAIESMRDFSLSEEGFIERVAAQLARPRELYLESMELPVAPFECRELAEQAYELLAFLDNIALMFADETKGTWTPEARRTLAFDQAIHARKALDRLALELEKM